jgi:hypothetical protein
MSQAFPRIKSMKKPLAVLALGLAATLAASCAARGELPYLRDPAWSGLLAADAEAAERGLSESGYRVRSLDFAMKDLPDGLNSLLVSRKEGIIALSPLFGSDIIRLHAIFPEKTFVIPGGEVPEGINSFGSRSDFSAALEILGKMAADAAKEKGKGASPGLFYAAALFPSNDEGEAQKTAFIRGFSAEIQDSSRDYLLTRSIGDDKAEAAAAIAYFASYDVKFLFLSAGPSSPDALAAVPERGWTVTGLRLKALSGTHPSLAASIEDDWEALARQALALARSAPGEASSATASVPGRILRLEGDRRGLFSNFKR